MRSRMRSYEYRLTLRAPWRVHSRVGSYAYPNAPRAAAAQARLAVVPRAGRAGVQRELEELGAMRMVVNQLCLPRDDSPDNAYRELIQTAIVLLAGGNGEVQAAFMRLVEANSEDFLRGIVGRLSSAENLLTLVPEANARSRRGAGARARLAAGAVGGAPKRGGVGASMSLSSRHVMMTATASAWVGTTRAAVTFAGDGTTSGAGGGGEVSGAWTDAHEEQVGSITGIFSLLQVPCLAAAVAAAAADVRLSWRRRSCARGTLCPRRTSCARSRARGP